MEKRGGGGKKMDEGQSRGSVQEEALSWGPVLLRLGGPGNRPWLANTGPASGSLGCLETPLHSRKPTQEIPASPEGTPPQLVQLSSWQQWGTQTDAAVPEAMSAQT